MRGARFAAALAGLALLSACASEAKPVYQEEPVARAVITTYDEQLEPSAAVLALVPAEAETVSVTDFEQLRLVLGLGSMQEASPADVARFWRRLPRTATLSRGLLRGVDARLRADFGFTQDDVAWEARYTGAAKGWILAFRNGTSMDAVARAVKAGVGPLADAVVDADRRLVTSAKPPEPEAAWGAEPGLAALGGQEAVATYLSRGCLDVDSVFGKGVQAKLAAEPAAALRDLDELDGFALAMGSELATVQLGPKRRDAFDRVRLAENLPATVPDFNVALTRPVADPSTGRLGYTLDDPAAAAELTRTRQLPFAVCAG
ncbi:hypothetical protein KG112_10430 [Nocardioides sp. zg-ZUI104]|uniref:hypothetical protein n=1 Tax=Nocardioides faecalis TaxID=2803858 RepID=UPI001BCC5566|nr:hypothetical protein [Nocardioides faecalis]MBS4753218.1 hypothetical protein [Nocardioides faecalis]